MSSHSNSETNGPASDVTATAAAWLERTLREGWNSQDREALDAWLLESPLHQIAYWRLEAAWNETYRLAALRSQPLQYVQCANKSDARSVVFKAVAGLTLIVALGMGAMWLRSPDAHTRYATALGERKVLALADGSQIELNTDTVLVASIDKRERKVWLQKGEAYFRIKHDAARPFVVEASGRRITDLGTKFVVRSTPKLLRVAVLEGRVGLTEQDGSGGRELKPGDVAIARQEHLAIARAPTAEIAAELSWRQGRLVFHHTPLSEAAAEFNRYGDEKLLIADAAVGRITINGTFSVGDTAAFARLAHMILGLHVEAQGKAITISGKPSAVSIATQ